MKMNLKSRLLTLSMAMMLGVTTTEAAYKSFVAEGGGIRNGKIATVKGKQVLYLAEIDGAVSCHTLEGKRLWRNDSPNPSVNFELNVADLDGDGSDDLLSVCGDGSVSAWGSDGELMWRYMPEGIVRLSELAVVGEGDKMRIYTGGNTYTIFELDRSGRELSATKVDGTIRKLEVGEFIEKGKPSLFVFTLKHDKSGSQFLGYMDPTSKEILASGAMSKIQPKGGHMLHNFRVADINNDGLDEVVIFSDGVGGAVFAINGKLERVMQFAGTQKSKQRYAHGVGEVLMPEKGQIVLQYGGIIYVVDGAGKLIGTSGERHRGVIYNDLVVDHKSGTLFGLGQIGGDNSVYAYDLSKKDWYTTEHQFMGLQQEVEQNVNTIFEQAMAFKMPAYQTKSKKSYMIDIPSSAVDPKVSKLKGNDIVFIDSPSFGESTDRGYMVEQIGESAAKRDGRKKYTDSRESIIKYAADMEAKGEPFIFWAGHGNDPFYVQLETLEGVIKAAPTVCHGFIYAEMANTRDPRVVHFVREYVPRLHKVINESNSPAKLYFRYKNMFWAADCHSDLWSEMFFSGKYNDILVPAAEDTNNRLQDLNFSGRVGMYMSGYVDDYAMRLVDDNPTSWRPLSPGGQRSVSPYLRNGAIMAAYGARYALIFGIGYIEQPGWNSLFALMASGAIPAIDREDLLSVSSYMLIKEMDEPYLEHSVNNGHDIVKHDKMDADYVISKAGVHWCGADVPAYDYSKAMGVDYRWLNFMPEMPNGMVAITDYAVASRFDKEGVDYFVTDARYGIVGEKKLTGEEFYPTMSDAIESGAAKMPMRVDGASWSLFRVGERQARLVAVDPGYINPQQRTAVIKFQNQKPIAATNILTGEKLKIKGNTLEITVPAGTLSIVDFEYSAAI